MTIRAIKERLLPAFTRPNVFVCVAVGGVAGTCIGLQALDRQFILGTGGKWIRPENDYVAYLVAWNYFIIDHWRLPIFSLPAMGYPEGGSVLFNDALPLTAILTKIAYQLTGFRINPYGWWAFLTYVLQGAMAARIVCAVGVRSIWACGAAAVLASTTTAFVWRMGHTALSSHFLLLWAIALYFESVRHKRARIAESSILLAVTLLVNAYLFAMVFVFLTMTVVTMALRGQLARREFAAAALGTGLVVVLGLVSGYGVLLVSPSSLKAEGFGFFSWNLATLLLPPEGFAGFLSGFPRNVTGGQYEGEAYVGHGVLLLLALSLLLSPRALVRHVRNHWPCVITLGACAAYAASNKVYLGNWIVLEYPLPAAVQDLTSFFRANGRFIWPVAYTLATLSVAYLFRHWRRPAAIVAASLAVCLQLLEARPGIEGRRAVSAAAMEDLIESPVFESWLAQHDRLWQYPSWACGGLEGSKRVPWNLEANRELQVELATARAGLPTNSVYTSRPLKQCVVEFEWAKNPRLEDGVLYLLSRETAATSATLTALGRSKACVRLSWAIACSRKWASMASTREVDLPEPRK